MDTEELIGHIDQLRNRIQEFTGEQYSNSNASAAKAQVCEFLRRYAGPKSSFYQEVKELSGTDNFMVEQLSAVLKSFRDYVEAGLHEEISPERRAQIDTVSDILDQAQRLLDDSKTHPGASVVLVGAALEEFLRTWIESEDISLGNRNRGIQNYAQVIYKEELIEKQDLKDITSWGGMRNSAAHGEWEKVDNRQKVELMLQGVNLFMRKYGT